MGKSGPTCLRISAYTANTKRRRLLLYHPTRPCVGCGVGRQKLTDQVTVGPVNLNATETGFLADRRAASKALNDLPNLSHL
jgi:hypothetical protein